jgi:hypothetical protein
VFELPYLLIINLINFKMSNSKSNSNTNKNHKAAGGGGAKAGGGCAKTKAERLIDALAAVLLPPDQKAKKKWTKEELEANALVDCNIKNCGEFNCTFNHRLQREAAKAREEANAKAKAEARARAEANAKAKAEAKVKAKAEADAVLIAQAHELIAQARADAEAKVKADAEAKVKAEAEAKLTQQPPQPQPLTEAKLAELLSGNKALIRSEAQTCVGNTMFLLAIAVAMVIVAAKVGSLLF